MVPPRLPTALQRHCFICYPNAATPAPWHSSTSLLLRQQERSHIYLQTCPDPAQHPAAPFVSRADPRDLQQYHADVHFPQRNPSCPGPQASQGAQGKEQLNPTKSSPTPRLAGVSPNPPASLRQKQDVNRGMSRLAQLYRAPAGAINLYSAWKEECTSQQRSGAGGGVSGKERGRCLFIFW